MKTLIVCVALVWTIFGLITFYRFCVANQAKIHALANKQLTSTPSHYTTIFAIIIGCGPGVWALFGFIGLRRLWNEA